MSSRRQSIQNFIKEQAILAVIRTKNYHPANNHYIFADPRGGSTWMMEVIQEITNEPVVWEPLHLGIRNNPFKDLGFSGRQYIPEDSTWDEALYLFDTLFKGKTFTHNILSHSSFRQLLTSDSLLFKICRGAALLPWLTNTFSFNYKPIYLVRHPFAVTSSQLRHGAWNFSFENFYIPEEPFNGIYQEHKSFLKTIKTKEEALVAEWCLANSVPLSSPHNNLRWITINYEEFLLNPVKTFERILNEWDTDYDLSTIDFKKNSVSAKKDTPEKTIERLNRWKRFFNEEQLKGMSKVLDHFEITTYSNNNPLPEKVYNYG